MPPKILPNPACKNDRQEVFQEQKHAFGLSHPDGNVGMKAERGSLIDSAYQERAKDSVRTDGAD